MTWIISKAMMEHCESLHYSQAPEVEFSEEKFSDGKPYAQLSVMPTQHKFWHRDKMMEYSNLSRFGLTCAVLTESHGEDLLTLFRAGFLVRTYQSQEKEKGLLARGLGFGVKCGALLARFCQDACIWKTAQRSLFEEEQELLQILPNWGMWENGELWELTPADLTIIEPDFGWLPTARKSMANNGICWARADSEHNGNIEDFLAQQLRKTGVDRIRGLSVSASFVTLLMDWPQKWTNLQPLEMDRFQLWRQQHSISFRDEVVSDE
jgi:hypothetical protein